MKIMPVKNVFNRLNADFALRKEQREIGKYFSIDENLKGTDVYKKIYGIRKAMADYAKDEKVSIKISDARHLIDEHDTPYVDKLLAKSLDVSVYDLKTGKGTGRFIDKDLNKIYNNVEKDYFIVDFHHDGVQQTRITKHEYEDDFFRNLYRNISKMVKDIHNKK